MVARVFPLAAQDGGSALAAGTQGDAAARSQADAGMLAAPGSAASCCVASGVPGCAEPAVAVCLCQLDPFCCSQQHDELCVREAVSSCGLECTPPPAQNDCCTPSASAGCSSAALLACVCEVDPACCQLRFDQSCVNLASARCGAACGAGEAP